MIEYLATGVGHCGTGYVAVLFRKNGIPSGHEQVFSTQGIRPENLGNMRMESSWYAAATLDHELLANAYIIHLVRHPLAVFRSWIHAEPWRVHHPERRGLRIVIRCVPEVVDIENDFERMAARYVGWNKMIEQNAPTRGRSCLRWRIEDGGAGLLEALGIERGSGWDDPSWNHHSVYNKNARGGRPVQELKLPTWNDIPEGQYRRNLMAMCKEYGYEPYTP